MTACGFSHPTLIASQARRSVKATPALADVCQGLSSAFTVGRAMFIPDAAIGEFIPFSTHVSPTVLKTTGGDFLLVWRLGGLPFVGREEWEIEHRHNTFNRMLQTLRAPDFVNVAFWVHDIRRRRGIKDKSKFEHTFNQALSDGY